MPTDLPLADIHFPQAPSFWPLPASFWLVIIVSFMTIATVLFFAIRWQRSSTEKHAAKREALRILGKIKSEQSLTALNTLLRQTALSYFPRQEVASLQGKAWLHWLQRQGNNAQFADIESLWIATLYGTHQLSDREWQQCFDAAKQWLNSLDVNAIKGGHHV
ncbi:DUF4381 domain-containing protein [Thaumasiovibrio subtropicus]|uniref:DUF4381 domain-containing protein n=1 Tax=Thaumasiovibrio subtropicus TaxID=1891207 RepID=UPI000B34EF02|nr:DUF4381 domain-containing protein [Thaumasiovibrio subtropicus]